MLFKNFVPFTWYESESEQGRELLAEWGWPKKSPVVECSGGRLLFNPGLRELAQSAGVWRACPLDAVDAPGLRNGASGPNSARCRRRPVAEARGHGRRAIRIVGNPLCVHLGRSRSLRRTQLLGRCGVPGTQRSRPYGPTMQRSREQREQNGKSARNGGWQSGHNRLAGRRKHDNLSPRSITN